ncbi:uncharacterized protein LOC132266312 [Cornus florida]|uniref:uncharacterized protein LOC132266312 n=1 Tax=Cornus florida TaxID=4283 RepID=UPI0028A0DDC2|nr:uncharacterized protein LOC132266312 [Cornus florida]
MPTISRIHTFERRLIIIKKWDKNVNLSKEVLDLVLVWLRIHNLPIHCHNGDSVSKVYFNFSKLIYLDDLELHQDKGDFVRVMVEVEIKEELPESMVVDIHGFNYDIDLEYEWKPTLCDLCQKIDHLAYRCPLKVLQAKPKKGVDKWVVKNKGKTITVDEVFEEMPIRTQVFVVHVPAQEMIQVSNTFAALEEKEDRAIEEPTVEDCPTGVQVMNLVGVQLNGLVTEEILL